MNLAVVEEERSGIDPEINALIAACVPDPGIVRRQDTIGDGQATATHQYTSCTTAACVDCARIDLEIAVCRGYDAGGERYFDASSTNRDQTHLSCRSGDGGFIFEGDIAPHTIHASARG